MSEPSDMEKIQEVIDLFDPENDEHWTREGYPKIERVQELADVSGLSRKDLTEMYPGWVRNPEPDEIESEEESGEPAEMTSREDIESAVLKQQAIHDSILEEQVLVENAIKESLKVLDALNDRLIEEFPPPSASEVHQQYVKSQQTQRAARVVKATTIREQTGLNVSGSAPVDNVPKK